MVKNLMRKTGSFFGARQNTILSAAGYIGIMVLSSRFLGLVRDRLLTGLFTPDELGIYFAAFRLPNLIFELITMGVISTAFIPVFVTALDNDGEDRAFAMVSSVLNLAFFSSLMLSAIVFIFAPFITPLIAPGFNPQEQAVMIGFIRILVITQVLPLSLGTFINSVLQSYRYFFLAALAPVVYNIGTIAGILTLSNRFGLYAPVIGVGFGAVLFLLIQLPQLYKIGYRHKYKTAVKDKYVREVGKLMLPRTLGLAVGQIDSTVDLILASLGATRNVTVFYLAQQLQMVPIGLFGASIAQAALPSLSQIYARKNMEEFKRTFLTAFHQILFLALPTAAAFAALRVPLIRLIFGAKRFDFPATVETGRTLSLFAVSLFAGCTVQLLARAFYALHDTKTPVAAGVVSVLVNTFLSILLIVYFKLPVPALAASASVGSIVNFLLLICLLDKKLGGFNRRDLILPFVKMGFAASMMALVLQVAKKLLDNLVFNTAYTTQVFLLTMVSGGLGFILYLSITWVLDVKEVGLFLKLAKKVIPAKFRHLEVAPEMMETDKKL